MHVNGSQIVRSISAVAARELHPHWERMMNIMGLYGECTAELDQWGPGCLELLRGARLYRNQVDGERFPVVDLASEKGSARGPMRGEYEW